MVTWPGTGPDNFSQQAAALPALLFLGAADPLVAAVEALWAAAGAHGERGYRALFADARAAFPALRG